MPFQLGLCLARKPISSDSMGEERRFVERLRSKLADWSYLGRAFWGLWGSTSSCQSLGVLFESRVFSRFCSSVWVLGGDGVFSDFESLCRASKMREKHAASSKACPEGCLQLDDHEEHDGSSACLFHQEPCEACLSWISPTMLW